MLNLADDRYVTCKQAHYDISRRERHLKFRHYLVKPHFLLVAQMSRSAKLGVTVRESNEVLKIQYHTLIVSKELRIVSFPILLLYFSSRLVNCQRCGGCSRTRTARCMYRTLKMSFSKLIVDSFCPPKGGEKRVVGQSRLFYFTTVPCTPTLQ